MKTTITINATITVESEECSLRAPGPLSISQVGETMADQIQMRVVSTADADATSREVTITVEGVDNVLTYPIGDTTEASIFTVEQGKEFGLSVVDLDDAGNESPATTGTFTAQDTFAPVAPGALGVEAVGEIQG